MQQLNEFEKKKKLYRLYHQEQGVVIDRDEHDRLFSLKFDKRQFEMLLSKKLLKTREHKAAIIISKFWRGCKTREWVKIRKAEMIASAKRIQSAWRLYWFLQIGPRIRRAKFFKAASTVQKFMRGYIYKKHVYKELMEHKVNYCYEHFMRIKKEREAAARLILRYYCRKYFVKRKAKKLAEIARKKALAEKKAAEAAKRNRFGRPAKKKKKKPAVDKQKTLDKDAGSTMGQTTTDLGATADNDDDDDDDDNKGDNDGEEGEKKDVGLEDKDDVNTERGDDDINDRNDEDNPDGKPTEGSEFDPNATGNSQ